jgi:hypothetical protein
MKTKNKMMVALLVISAITAGLMPVNAATNQLSATRLNVDKPARVSDVKPIPSNSLFFARPVETVDLSTLDESTIDERISEAEQAAPVEEDTAAPLWYLNAYGYTTITSPTVDAAQNRFRIRLQMVAEKVKVTEFGVLYEVHWGRVTHNGEQFTVSGYALLDSDGIFYMKLEGETAFKAIGQIHGAWFGVRVSMKGYLVDDEITYSHQMRGWAIPLTNNLILRLRKHLQ